MTARLASEDSGNCLAMAVTESSICLNCAIVARKVSCRSTGFVEALGPKRVCASGPPSGEGCDPLREGMSGEESPIIQFSAFSFQSSVLITDD